MDAIGVSCYSSRDLIHWRNEGLVLQAVRDGHASDLHPSKVMERPKVIYNARTGQFVMWLHVDTADYTYARAGVAVSDRPAGPYRYLGSMRPLCAESRDMTVFKDDNGSAYLIHSSEGNATLRIVPLSDDYLRPSGEFTTASRGRYREAPAVFKHDKIYFMFTSGCTGWAPNAAEYATAPSPAGPWRARGNPCVGTEEEKASTFGVQSAFVLPVANSPGKFIFMADRWNAEELGDSRYVWLPLEIDGDNLRIRWYDEWDLELFTIPRLQNGIEQFFNRI